MNEREIKQALKDGKKVHCYNSGYVVLLSPSSYSGLAIHFLSNGYYTVLDYSEFKDCFIAE